MVAIGSPLSSLTSLRRNDEEEENPAFFAGAEGIIQADVDADVMARTHKKVQMEEGTQHHSHVDAFTGLISPGFSSAIAAMPSDGGGNDGGGDTGGDSDGM